MGEEGEYGARFFGTAIFVCDSFRDKSRSSIDDGEEGEDKRSNAACPLAVVVVVGTDAVVDEEELELDVVIVV